jgi:hypothetical protein
MIEHDLLLLQRSERLCPQAMPPSWYTGTRRFIALLLAASYNVDRGISPTSNERLGGRSKQR